ncbi:uncharacterized protein LOC142588158 [Dermacentor variabilis]|uniref:uncharacterized protein LOC142588158 n=1 Tax=Dermacentor variabilis TaxID=34621 RepID=UPI003F5BF6A8
MAAAKRRHCFGPSDFDVVNMNGLNDSARDTNISSTPCFSSDARETVAAKRLRLAEVLETLDGDSSDSIWSSTSDSSCSSTDDTSSNDDYEMYAAISQELFSLPEERPKVDSYIGKTVSSYSDEEFKRNFRITRPVADLLAAEFAKSPHCPKKSDRGGLPAKSPEEHILSFLW